MVRLAPVDAVKEIFRSRATAIRVELRALESEVTTQLTTPRGRPASARIDIRARDVSGVFWAGLSTTVQPAASAGPILRVPIDSGKFHGVISSEGPTGRATVSTASSADGACRNRPGWRTASSANQRRNSAP